MTARPQRFTRNSPCPVCGGFDEAPRGKGMRCYGFLSEDGSFAHCTREEQAGALPRNPGSQTFAHKLEGPCKCGKTHRLAKSNSPGDGKAKEPVATWGYYTAEGAKLFEVCRFETPAGKSYGVRRPDGNGGLAWGLGGVKPVLYNLPGLRTASRTETVWVPEGEKLAEALDGIGCMATTSPFGAKFRWPPEFSEEVRGRRVVILSDADQEGRHFAQEKARALWGKADSIRILDLFPDRDDGSDVFDWIAERKARLETEGLEEVEVSYNIKTELEALAQEAPEWRPPEDCSAGPIDKPSPAEPNLAPPRQVFFSPAELAIGEGTCQVDWLWEGFLAPGHITLLAGKPRASGKSTFTFGLVRALLSAEPFLGFSTRRAKGVLLLSEETQFTLLEKVNLFGLGEHPGFLIAPRHATAGLSWEDTIGLATQKAKEVGAELVIVDSLSHFSRFPRDAAKDSGAVNEAFVALQSAAAQGLAVLPIHHHRKGGGEAGEGVRDSNAIVANSDIVLELSPDKRFPPTYRVVEALSRFRSTPPNLVLDFDKETGDYTYLGTLEEFQDSQKEAERDSAAREMAALLPAAVPGLTQQEVQERSGLGKSQVSEHLRRAVSLGLARRNGKGGKKDPFRYSRLDGSGSEETAEESGVETEHSASLFGGLK